MKQHFNWTQPTVIPPITNVLAKPAVNTLRTTVNGVPSAIQPIVELVTGVVTGSNLVVGVNGLLSAAIALPPDRHVTAASLNAVTNILTITGVNDQPNVTVDLTGLAIDVKPTAFLFNPATGLLTLTNSDGTTNTVTITPPAVEVVALASLPSWQSGNEVFVNTTTGQITHVVNAAGNGWVAVPVNTGTVKKFRVIRSLPAGATTILHNLALTDLAVIVQIFNMATNEQVIARISSESANSVNVSVTNAIASVRITVLG